MKPAIRLSQCMIVKNEEKNIRQALSWGKSIVCEQIVVDTGSSDHTVEIAEEMGAKVYHFPWINDFSAAKNFAIERATGNWIAFLDADEFFASDDTKKIIPLLVQLDQNSGFSRKYHVVRSSCVHLDDDGIPFSSGVQDRIFRRLSKLRYQNKIHESLNFLDGSEILVFDATKKLSVFHTGYAAQNFREAHKAERNIFLLRQEVEENPENYDNLSYLGDTLVAAGRWPEAEEVYGKVIRNAEKPMEKTRLSAAFSNLLRVKYFNNEDQEEEILNIYEMSKKFEFISPDAEYWVGQWMFLKGKEDQGIAYYELALKRLEEYTGLNSSYVSGDLKNVYKTLSLAYKNLGRLTEMIRYGVLSLRMDPYQEEIIKEILILFKNENGEKETAYATYNFLMKLYDASSTKDKFFLIKISKLISFPALEDRIYESLSMEDKAFLNGRNYSVNEVVGKWKRDYPDFVCRNEVDREFVTFIEEIKNSSQSELLLRFQELFNELKEKYKTATDNYIECFARFPFWGTLNPEENKFEPVEQRIAYVQTNVESFIWLYCNLGDYRSKKVLLSILGNWIYMDTDNLRYMKKDQKEYFDIDLIPGAESHLFVDVGASTGDISRLFIDTYGEVYKKIYCYEAEAGLYKTLERNLRGYDDIVLRPVAVDSAVGKGFIVTNKEDATTTYVIAEASQGKAQILAQTTTLDSDIPEKIDILKINVNGYEENALLGAKQHIQKDHPCLLVALDHKFDHLTNIPRRISEMNNTYKFYLRYYGGDLIPTNFILYAL